MRRVSNFNSHESSRTDHVRKASRPIRGAGEERKRDGARRAQRQKAGGVPRRCTDAFPKSTPKSPLVCSEAGFIARRGPRGCLLVLRVIAGSARGENFLPRIKPEEHGCRRRHAKGAKGLRRFRRVLPKLPALTRRATTVHRQPSMICGIRAMRCRRASTQRRKSCPRPVLRASYHWNASLRLPRRGARGRACWPGVRLGQRSVF